MLFVHDEISTQSYKKMFKAESERNNIHHQRHVNTWLKKYVWHNGIFNEMFFIFKKWICLSLYAPHKYNGIDISVDDWSQAGSRIFMRKLRLQITITQTKHNFDGQQFTHSYPSLQHHLHTKVICGRCQQFIFCDFLPLNPYYGHSIDSFV